MTEPEQPQPNIFIDQQQMAGVWSNFARVTASPYEFTLDFVRLDFGSQPPQGVVVSRISLSPLMVSQLIDALQNQWTHYAELALPPEWREHGAPPSGPAESHGEDPSGPN